MREIFPRRSIDFVILQRFIATIQELFHVGIFVLLHAEKKIYVLYILKYCTILRILHFYCTCTFKDTVYCTLLSIFFYEATIRILEKTLRKKH